MLFDNKGNEVKIGPGIRLIWNKSTHCLCVTRTERTGINLRWGEPTGDDKHYVSFIKTESDFVEFARTISDMCGDHSPRPERLPNGDLCFVIV